MAKNSVIDNSGKTEKRELSDDETKLLYVMESNNVFSQFYEQIYDSLKKEMLFNIWEVLFMSTPDGKEKTAMFIKSFANAMSENFGTVFKETYSLYSKGTDIVLPENIYQLTFSKALNAVENSLSEYFELNKKIIIPN
jgi:hypothetical protein